MKYIAFLFVLGIVGCSNLGNSSQSNASDRRVKIATFNVSMEATNYREEGNRELNADALINELSSGMNQQIKNIAEIIQRVRPDVVLLNEFDYVESQDAGIQAFLNNYLKVSQQHQLPIDYPFIYLAPVNTGVRVPDLLASKRFSHFGFGRYPGQYGMVLLSKFPIKSDQVRTFQHFLWQDMPGHLMPTDAKGNAWYDTNAQRTMRLSSKSHWDIPLDICGQDFHVLASHPTPPVFDGDEDRNGRRNHDEIRFWRDYLDAEANSYHYDDQGKRGGIKANVPFVILGDLNASAVEGNAHPSAISQLLNHERVNDYTAPTSEGGRENKPNNPHSESHTAGWGMRADYVLPSSDTLVTTSGVFWPVQNDELSRLVKDRKASSDHRLVWAELELPNKFEHCSR